MSIEYPDAECNCEPCGYENEDGICEHPACEGDKSREDCGKLVYGVPTSPEECKA